MNLDNFFIFFSVHNFGNQEKFRSIEIEIIAKILLGI